MIGLTANHAFVRAVLSAAALVTVVGGAFAQSQLKSRIAFVGDSMSDGYWEGLTQVVERNPCLRSHLELGRFIKNSSGLVRTSYIDWAAELVRIGARYKPQLFVMSVGANDVGYNDDKYRSRIIAVLESAAATRVPLLWIGLPAMRATERDRDAGEKNKLFEEVITARTGANAQYVESWKLNKSGADKFASYGPDEKGRIVQIRSADGAHFTFAGNVLTAVYLLPKIVATLPGSSMVDCESDEVKGQ
jgi:hypothetical protein